MQSPGWCGVGCHGAAPSDSSAQLGGLVCLAALFACVVRMCLARVLWVVVGALWLWYVLFVLCFRLGRSRSCCLGRLDLGLGPVDLGRLDLSRLDLESS